METLYKYRGLGLATRCFRERLSLVYANPVLDRLEVDGDVRNEKSEAGEGAAASDGFSSSRQRFENG